MQNIFCAYRITPANRRHDLGLMTLHPDVTLGQGVVTEAWLTFILVQTVWGALNSRRRRVLSPSIPIGLAYSLGTMAGVRGFFSFLFNFFIYTCPTFGPLVPLFWISGKVSSRFESQSGFLPYLPLQR